MALGAPNQAWHVFPLSEIHEIPSIYLALDIPTQPVLAGCMLLRCDHPGLRAGAQRTFRALDKSPSTPRGNASSEPEGSPLGLGFSRDRRYARPAPTLSDTASPRLAFGQLSIRRGRVARKQRARWSRVEAFNLPKHDSRSACVYRTEPSGCSRQLPLSVDFRVQTCAGTLLAATPHAPLRNVPDRPRGGS